VRALITGVTGQDGSYLAELLLSRGWDVWGLVRRLSWDNHHRIAHLGDLRLVSGDLLDQGCLIRLMAELRPDHVYNLAAQSFVPTSVEQPVLTGEATALGAARVLEAVRIACRSARVYQASSSEMFGLAATSPQDERTPFHPRSPYGAAKVYAHHLAVNYRESHGIFTCCGILFNHESPRRSPEFVTRKIARGVAAIVRGRASHLALGNLDARRDWGWAPDYVQAMHAMLCMDEPGDWVVATGQEHSVAEFAEAAFAVAGLDWRDHVRVDPTLLRPADIPGLVGNASRARRDLGWSPTVPFADLVRRMVEAELAA
jgi:GDPmannose 4,6-dehydratase